jgi:hypothetical protein
VKNAKQGVFTTDDTPSFSNIRKMFPLRKGK